MSTPVRLSKITLEKKGDSQAVDLKKDGQKQPFHINLNWGSQASQPKKGGLFGALFGGGSSSEAPDLDLGCMYEMQDGSKGVVQPLGGNFGSRDGAPYIFLDKDDRTGAAADGENLYIYRPDLIKRVMIFALIYEGADDFSSVGGRMTIADQSGRQIEIHLSNPDARRTFCAVCTITNRGDHVEVRKEEQYFEGHEDADAAYKFGFRWVAGRK